VSATVVPKFIFEILIRHLIKIEEEKIDVIEKYYPQWTNERQSFQEIMDKYIKGLENIIYNEIVVEDNASGTCPFVLIGSRMILKNEDTNEIEDIQIISPFNGEIDLNIDSASYLSPVGRAFLLKRVYDSVKVETPMGLLRYKIEAVELPDE
jgi:transcription elongation factor GreA